MSDPARCHTVAFSKNAENIERVGGSCGISGSLETAYGVTVADKDNEHIGSLLQP